MKSNGWRREVEVGGEEGKKVGWIGEKGRKGGGVVRKGEGGGGRGDVGGEKGR